MPHKLLLADDSVTIQRVVELTFADEDVQVRTAADGEQAIASIQAEPPDIVLADIGMPKRSGYDVAAFVKSAPHLSHIPVLLLTGAFEPVDERRAQAAGCDGVLVKPFEPQHVIARVRELLQGRRSPGAPGSVMPAVADVPRPVDRLTPHRQVAPRGPVGAERHDAVRPAQDAAGRGGDLDDYFDRLDAAFANLTTPADTSAARQPEVHQRREGPVMERDLDWFDSPARPAAEPAAAPAPPPPASYETAPEPPAASIRPEPPAPPAPIDPPAHEHTIAPQAHTIAAAPAPDALPDALPDPVPPTIPAPPVVPAMAPQPPSIEPPDAPVARASQPHQKQPPPSSRAAETADERVFDSGSMIAEAFSALLAAEQGDTDAPALRLPLTRATPAVTDELVDEISRRVAERLGRHALDDLVADIVSRIAERLVREEIDRIRGKHA